MPLVQTTKNGIGRTIDNLPASYLNIADMSIARLHDDPIVTAKAVAAELSPDELDKLIDDWFENEIRPMPKNAKFLKGFTHVVKPSYWYSQRKAAKGDDELHACKVLERVYLVVSVLTDNKIENNKYIVHSNEGSQYASITDLFIRVNDKSTRMSKYDAL
jgi:hypothetical protein